MLCRSAKHINKHSGVESLNQLSRWITLLPLFFHNMLRLTSLCGLHCAVFSTWVCIWDPVFPVLMCSLFAGIFLPVSTQNTIPHISSSTQAPSWASSSQSCLSFTEYGYLGSTSTDRTDWTLDYNQHWTSSFLVVLNCFMCQVREEPQFDLCAACGEYFVQPGKCKCTAAGSPNLSLYQHSWSKSQTVRSRPWGSFYCTAFKCDLYPSFVVSPIAFLWQTALAAIHVKPSVGTLPWKWVNVCVRLSPNDTCNICFSCFFSMKDLLAACIYTPTINTLPW